MAKRKREAHDHDSVRGQNPKKVKSQNVEDSKPEVTEDIQPKEDIAPAQNGSEQRHDMEGVALAKKSKKRERRRLRKEQEEASQAHVKVEKEEANDTGRAKDLKKKRKDEEQNNQNQLISEEGEQAGNVVSEAMQEPRKRKRKRRAMMPERIQQDSVDKSDNLTISNSREHKRKGKSKSGTNPSQLEKPRWKVSDPVGGKMLDVDPIFSRDEKYLLVAYDIAITVYSASASLPVRRLRSNKSDKHSAFALSSLTDSQVYISTFAGEIEKWDWMEGKRLGRWKLSSSIHSMTTPNQAMEASDIEAVYTIDQKEPDQWRISAHHLRSGEHAAKTDVKTLFKYQGPLSSLKILADGRFIIASSGSRLIIGSISKLTPAKLQDLSYTWRIVECPEWITCVDARISQPERIEKPSKGGKRKFDALDIAVGGLKGSIHVYDNLLGKLIHTEQPTNGENPEDIKSRRLHWHRNAVLSLKWSLDGNYLISGGQETVLVLWQLETGRRQDLPHLGAPIESIVVSPYGASYAIRLADNSAMILSTSELAPTFSIAGIQIPSGRDDSSPQSPFIPTVDMPYQRKHPAQQSQSPACVSPSRPGCLLLAVPASDVSRQKLSATQNASYLQSFDVGAAHQTSRQALTRTRITDLNIGPESNTVEEPNVTHIQTSRDGQWLASIDVWTPPKRDLEPLAFDKERLAEEQALREEIHLKFWSWNDDAKVWELVSRIDNPHASQSGDPYEDSNVLQLTSDPSSVGFATVGANGVVKTWKPAIRRRHGLDVRDKEGRGLTSWHCKHAISLESTSLSSENSQLRAKLAYSIDGSILVVGLQARTSSPLYVLDAYSGEIRDVQYGLYNGPLLGLAVVSKYLITLSDELCVWDLISNELHYGIDLQHTKNIPVDKRILASHLAVYLQHGIFAIALPGTKHHDKKSPEQKSQIAIFDPTNAVPLYQTSAPNPITNLLPIAGRKGFYAIDSAAEIRTIVPTQSLPPLPLPPSTEDQPSARGLRDIFGNGQSTKASEDTSGKGGDGPLNEKFDTVTLPSRIRDDDTVVVNQDQLAEVFEVGAAYPPVMDMFARVAGLYSGRTGS